MKLIFSFFILVTLLSGNILIENNSKTIDKFELPYYNDISSSLDINDILKLDFNQSISNAFALGVKKGNMWFKFTFVNNSKNENFLLNLNEAWHDKVDLYSFKNGKIITSKNGLNIPIKDKEIKDPRPTFKIHIPQGQNKTFYLKIDTPNGFLGKFIVYPDENSYVNNKIISIALYMFFLGASFIVVVLNFFLFLTLKERIYIYYSMYALLSPIFMVSLSGIPEYIFNGAFYQLQFVSPLSLIFLILFSREILDTYRYTYRLDKVLIVFAVIAFIFTLLLFSSTTWFVLYQSFIPLVVMFIFYASITAWKKGSRDAKFYIIFILMYITSLCIIVMLSMGALKYTYFTRYSSIVASFLEMTFFALVLANRFNSTRKEKHKIEVDLEGTKELANHDSLTNLYNRHFLNSYQITCFNTARREQKNMSVIMLDIDHFKLVNDNYGHDVGDIILKNVANIFTSSTRKSDIIVRYGGEEFLIILANTDLENTQIIAEKIRINIEQLKSKYGKNKELSVTISLGIALLTEEDITMESVIKRADQALYDSKASGRNRISVTHN